MKIDRIDDVEAALGGRSLSQYGRLLRLEWRCDNEASPALALLLSCEQPGAGSLLLDLHGVAGFFVRKGGGQGRITGLDLVSIADRGWERLRWELVDFENRDIGCYAESVSLRMEPGSAD